MDVEIGLSDYIYTMAKPSWVWSSGLDFPRLYSWDDDAREELLKLFNYDTSLSHRGFLELEIPDFENLSLPSLCNSENFQNYCKIASNIPNLKTTMALMNTAKFPLRFSNSDSNFV